MIRALISIRNHDEPYFPEIGLGQNRLMVVRNSIKAVEKLAEYLAEGRPCRVEMWPATRKVMPKSPVTVYLNARPPEATS